MTHTPREYEKIHHSHNKFFWGEQSKILSRFKNCLREQRKETGLTFMVEIVDKALLWCSRPNSKSAELIA